VREAGISAWNFRRADCNGNSALLSFPVKSITFAPKYFDGTMACNIFSMRKGFLKVLQNLKFQF
jgi:hypothetical protein